MTHWILWYSGRLHSIKTAITRCPPWSSHLSLKSFPLMQGWSLVSCEGVGISQTALLLSIPIHCATFQKIKDLNYTPWQMPKILQDSTLLQPGMCLAPQIWFAKRCSLHNSKQNSVQTIFQIFQFPSLKFYWNMKVVHAIMSIKCFEKTYKMKLRFLSSGMPHSLTDM
jgi:hypothetical protein